MRASLDLSSDIQNPCKKLGMVVDTLVLVLEGHRQIGAQNQWPVGFTKIVSELQVQ